MSVTITDRVNLPSKIQSKGEGADAPVTFLNLADGVVLDSTVVETIEPDNLHGEEGMEEDDDFLSWGLR